MEMCLTGEPITAKRAELAGLVSRVFPPADLLPETEKVAEKIASMSKITLQITKEATNAALELPLQVGLRFERNQSNATFATLDRKEGMDAFVNKRKPIFQDR